MKVFVINVDKDNRRMETLHEHLMDHEIEYERVSAETGPTEEFGALKHVCHKGVAGSFASHRKCWKRIIDEDLEMAMILEDDARFTDEAPTTLKKVLEELPDDFDILYLGCGGICEETVGMNPLNLFLLPNILIPKKSKKISENLVVPAAPLEIHAYILSKDGAKKALSYKPKTCFGDYDLSLIPNMNVYACRPLIAIQDMSFDSHQKTTFPKLANYIIPKNIMINLNNQLYSVGVINISLTVLIIGVLCAMNPIFFVLLIPDIYASFQNIISVIFITLIIKIIFGLF